MTRRYASLPLVATLFLALILSTELAWSQNGRRPTGPARVANGQRPQGQIAPRQPFPPLSKGHQDYLEKVLRFWESNSAKIDVYRCKFTRWEYDPMFGPRNGKVKTIGEGEIKYAKPDKGLFHVTKMWDYVAPKKEGGKPTYRQRQGDGFEKWISDGQAIYEFDFPRKQIVEHKLPPDLRGKAITDGPLPFLFGAKAEAIKRRYWMRVVTPPGTKGEYWLEAWPKTLRDARNFKKVEIIIAEKDFLPQAIQVFDVNYHPTRSPKRTAYSFENREVNPFDLADRLDPLRLFYRDFHRPQKPAADWKWVEQNLAAERPAVPHIPARGNRHPSTAGRPTSRGRSR